MVKYFRGTYSKTRASLTCEKCPSGWMQDDQNGTECLLPPPGTIVGTGGASSVTVAPGWRISEEGMEECRSGTIGTEPPSDRCLLCPTGTSSYKASMSCHKCEEGKFANAEGMPTCIKCNQEKREFTPTRGSKNCRTCPTGKSSVLTACRVALNEDLPAPSLVLVQSTTNITKFYNAQETSVSSLKATVQWHVANSEQVNAFEVRLSSSGTFDASDDTATNTTVTYYSAIHAADACVVSKDQCPQGQSSCLVCMYQGATLHRALWQSVTYAQVRAVGDDYIPGVWSGSSKQWTVSSDCSNTADASQYLSTGASDGTNPTEFRCLPCPEGGSCDGSVTSYDIVAMFGWWRCSKETSGNKNVVSATRAGKEENVWYLFFFLFFFFFSLTLTLFFFFYSPLFPFLSACLPQCLASCI